MLKPILQGALPAILAGACALPLAHADIYTWTDESGRVNISNLAPPEGVRVTKVASESAPKAAARDDAARDALREAEVRLLAERVRQLQDEVELTKRPAPPPVEYRVTQPAPVAPPIIQYITLTVPQYPVAAQPVNTGCGFGWSDCTFGGYPGFYPVSVFVSRDKHFDHHYHHRPRSPTAPGRGLIAPWLPIAAPGGRGH